MTKRAEHLSVMSETRVLQTRKFWMVRRVHIQSGTTHYLNYGDAWVEARETGHHVDGATYHYAVIGDRFQSRQEAMNKLRTKTVRRYRAAKLFNGESLYKIQVVECQEQVVLQTQITYPVSDIPVLDRMAAVK